QGHHRKARRKLRHPSSLKAGGNRRHRKRYGRRSGTGTRPVSRSRTVPPDASSRRSPHGKVDDRYFSREPHEDMDTAQGMGGRRSSGRHNIHEAFGGRGHVPGGQGGALAATGPSACTQLAEKI